MQQELDEKIATLRIEKLMLVKSASTYTDESILIETKKKITEVNNEMKRLRKEYKEKIKEERKIKL